MCYFALFFLLQHVHSWIKIKEMSPRYQIKIEYCLLTAGLFNVFSFSCLFVVYLLDIKELKDIPAPPATSKRPVTDNFPGISNSSRA